MIKYAKILDNGALEYAPRDKAGVSNWGLNEELVLADGYLPIEDSKYPEDGKAYTTSYKEKDGVITTIYTEVIPSEEEIKQNQIFELKSKLQETDYVVIKIAEGVATPEEYAEVLANRKAWREEINELLNKE